MTREKAESLLQYKSHAVKGVARKRRSASKIHSISIENICQRLELLYKDEYRFEIITDAGKGTEIVISFPMEYGHQRRNNDCR